MISTLTPNSSSPASRSDTLASQRKLPSSMLPSHTSRYSRIERRVLRYSPASPGSRMSGSLTISMSGTPARLRSTRLWSPRASWMFLPASSSMWMRVSRTRFAAPSTLTSTCPPVHRGSSYWLIW